MMPERPATDRYRLPLLACVVLTVAAPVLTYIMFSLAFALAGAALSLRGEPVASVELPPSVRTIVTWVSVVTSGAFAAATVVIARLRSRAARGRTQADAS